MNIRPFYVAPILPKELTALREIAMNLWYSWNWEAVRLFIMIDRDIWEESYQNPVAMLGRVPQSRLKELALDDGFVANVERVHLNLKNYVARLKWFERNYGDEKDLSVAYFSCEFGLDEGLPVYSGGLGVLAGDHLKSATDLGIPLVGVGLLYRQGYFRQRLNADGWQMEEYPENDWYNMPVALERDESGAPIKVSMEMAGVTVKAQIWRVQVGNIRLYLLDTNFDENPPEAREITTQLYGGNRDMRLRQELLLGIGGVRALDALNIKPTVYHINEGHSAFQILERIANMMEREGMTFDEAKEIIWATNVFTTHTPVPAGNEQFQSDLLKKYLPPIVSRLKMSWEDFIRMGRINPGDEGELFGMTVLALRLSAFCNGVAALHGVVSRKMWQGIWKDLKDPNEVPIKHITNGIHTRSWLSHDYGDLFESYLGPRFAQNPWEFNVWDRVDRIPDIELWRTHQRRRERLVFFARQRLKEQLKRRGAQMFEITAADEALSPHALTIGFARRFATYKRANLLFSDLNRLKKLLKNVDRPIQFILAGKAHPQDTPAKEIIKEIIHTMREPEFRCSFVFIEDYDINVARYLVQGCDVWLNNPRRPQEASGTSGMKAAANGALNLSILDGWWDEAFNSEVGWAIGNPQEYDDTEMQDEVEAQALFDCLEHDVIPLFYHRDNAELPREWIHKMKCSMKMLGRQFNTHRMLEEYTETQYLPAMRAGKKLIANQYQPGKDLAKWRQMIRSNWNDVVITDVKTTLPGGDMLVGDKMSIQVKARLGSIDPNNVAVECLIGRLDSKGKIIKPSILRLDYESAQPDGEHLFNAEYSCMESGRHGYTVRIRAYNQNLVRDYSPDYVVWG
ncbi:MAG: alpha-glucan family phosphorylase [Candidatus Hinthialibacter antarcticus]|nr:alpha-glucan family phosphorylase [Candidatus Hinthialibacter antarcticus]